MKDDQRHAADRAGLRVALAALAALAIAMGIGRFAFTPILPMMQQDAKTEPCPGKETRRHL